MVLVAVCIALTLAIAGDLRDSEPLNFVSFYLLSLAAWLVVLLATAVVASRSLAADRRSGILDLVVASPLDQREIIDGTLLAVARHLRLGYLLATVLTMLVAGYIADSLSAGFSNGALAAASGILFGATVLVMGIACAATTSKRA